MRFYIDFMGCYCDLIGFLFVISCDIDGMYPPVIKHGVLEMDQIGDVIGITHMLQCAGIFSYKTEPFLG